MPGIFLKSSGVVRHTDVEMTVRKEEVFILSDPKKRDHTIPCRATREGTSVSQEAEGAKGKVDKSLSCGFCVRNG